MTLGKYNLPTYDVVYYKQRRGAVTLSMNGIEYTVRFAQEVHRLGLEDCTANAGTVIHPGNHILKILKRNSYENDAPNLCIFQKKLYIGNYYCKKVMDGYALLLLIMSRA
jgi:hypothetical protein